MKKKNKKQSFPPSLSVFIIVIQTEEINNIINYRIIIIHFGLSPVQYN